MSIQSVIPCPDCGSDIHMDSTLLLAGNSFSCVNEACKSSIAINPSEIAMVTEAINKFEELKKTSIEEGQKSAEADL